MEILLGSAEADGDRDHFFRTQILFWMLCAIDGHAKNFSLFLEYGGRYRLTPIYDVLSAFPVLGHGARKLSPKKVTMAMAIYGSKTRHYSWDSLLRRYLQETAKRCGMASKFEAMMDELLKQTPRAISQVESILPKDFPASSASPYFPDCRKWRSD